MSIPVFEIGHTAQLTWTASVAPDSAPRLAITYQDATIVLSQTVQTSGTLAFYDFFTMPGTVGIYRFEFLAQKSLVGSVYDFIERGLFKVDETKPYKS